MNSDQTESSSLAADSNDPLGQDLMSSYYRLGIGTEINYKKAAEYAQLAVDQDYLPAYNQLGFFYEHGQGVHEDKQKAFDLYMEAAKKGDCSCQWSLGWWYEDLSAEECDDDNPMWRNNAEEAFKWYKLAAENEDADANQFNSLAWCYLCGSGVKQDYEKALIWYQKSADLNDEEAQRQIKYIFTKKQLINQLQPNERDYWNEVKACSDYDCLIPDNVRHLLDKLQKL